MCACVCVVLYECIDPCIYIIDVGHIKPIIYSIFNINILNIFKDKYITLFAIILPVGGDTDVYLFKFTNYLESQISNIYDNHICL